MFILTCFEIKLSITLIASSNNGLARSSNVVLVNVIIISSSSSSVISIDTCEYIFNAILAS